MINDENLYLVSYINQETGEKISHYVLAEGLAHIESEFADIIKIEPLTNFINLLNDKVKKVK